MSVLKYVARAKSKESSEFILNYCLTVRHSVPVSAKLYNCSFFQNKILLSEKGIAMFQNLSAPLLGPSHWELACVPVTRIYCRWSKHYLVH